MGREHSPMHRRNVPEMLLMIRRTRTGWAKESFSQVWHKISSETLKYENPEESILHFTLFPFFIANEYILECQP